MFNHQYNNNIFLLRFTLPAPENFRLRSTIRYEYRICVSSIKTRLMSKKREPGNLENGEKSEEGFVVKSYSKKDTKKYAPKCDIALSKELQLQYRDEIMMEYKESLVVVRKRFDCRGFIHRLIKKNPNSKKRKKEYFDGCLNNDAGVVEKLLIDGLFPMTEDANGRNGVYYACIEGAFDSLRTCVNNQVSIITKNSTDLSTPLHLSCRGGTGSYRDSSEFLLENNADVDARDIRGQTPVMWEHKEIFIELSRTCQSTVLI